jgi:hypothetical protein
MRKVLEHRAVLNLALSLLTGSNGVQLWPLPEHNVFLAAIRDRKQRSFGCLLMDTPPLVYDPWIVLSVVTAMLYVAVMRGDKRFVYGALPPYPPPVERSTPYLVLGEQHHDTQPGRSEQPRWLTIPRRGLHTGVMIFGAVGTGKTSACMYPYVEQLLAWRPPSPDHKTGG